MKKLSILFILFVSLAVATKAQTPLVTTVDAVRMNNAVGVSVDSGIRVQVTGIVYGPNSYPTNNGDVFMLRNNGMSVKIYSKHTYGYSIVDGDSVMVVGTVSDYHGSTEISPNSTLPGDTILLLSSGHSIDTPLVVNNIIEANESQLIRINNVDMSQVLNWPATHLKHSFTAHVGTVYIFVDSFMSPDLWNGTAPTGVNDIIGFGSQYASAYPYTSGYSIQPRWRADFIPYTTGINDMVGKLTAAVFPNPASTQITVTFSYDRETSATVKLIDVTGRVASIQTGKVVNGDNTYTINTSEMANGFYVLEVNTGEKSLITKVNISK